MDNQNLKQAARDKWTHGSTQRVNRLRDQYWNWTPEIDTERAVVYTQTYREMEAYDACLKRAKSLYNYMAQRTVNIYPDELIIGTYGKQPRAAIVSPEICMAWVEEELDTMSTRSQDPYVISDEDKAILKELFPYWKGRTMEDYYIANVTPEAKKLAFGTNVVFGGNKSQSGGGEYLAGYRDIVFKKGFKGIKETTMEKHAALDQEDISTHEKRKFYESVMIICDAAKIQSDRYAAEARKEAEKAQDPKRREELLKIAAACERVPWEPPRNVLEAFHAIWFTQLMIWSEENATAYCIERIDQLLYPYYKAEKEAKTIDDTQMQELFDCFWIKLAEMIYFISDETAQAFAGYQPYHGVAVGGCREDGSDAVNELSYMVLQATANTQLHAPTINVRVSPNTCNEFMMAIAGLVEVGTGQPAIFFDKTAFEILRRNGIEEQDLWNWAVGGCVEPQIPGKMSMWAEGARFNYAMAVEWVMFNGLSRILGKEIGLKTGDPRTFKTYEQFEDACLRQLGHMIKAACQSAQVCERAHRLRMPIPVRSALMEGCLEQGKDAMDGGGTYNIGPGIESTGLTDMANAMAAVKKLVYDDKTITMDILVNALEADFEGYENIRQMLINDAPKYGNDEDYVDEIAAKICEASCDMCESYYSIRGTKFMNGVVPVISNVPCGQATWALPTGRKAKTPLSDGISPYPGDDQNGPSAVIKTITKLDHKKNGVGTLLNMKLSPDLLKTEEGKQNFIYLLRAEEELGGYHVQFNVVDKETLLDAQEHPEAHRDLLVRIAGYSAFFVELTSQAQEAIIARTEHSKW